MNKTKIEEIAFDGDINKFSQLRLAEWMIDRKKRVYETDIKTTINGIEFDTIGCDSTEDFVNKYQSLFEQIGLPNYDIRRARGENDDFINICIDNTGTLTTKNCTNVEDFKSINSELLSRLAPEEQEKYIQVASQYITNQNNIGNNQTVAQEEPKIVEPVVANNNPTSSNSNQQSDQAELENQLTELLKKQQTIGRRIIWLEKFKNGEVNKDGIQTPSFAERKAKLEQKIATIENKQQNTNNLNNEIATTKEQLESVLRRPGRFSTEEETRVLQQYYTVISRPNERKEQINPTIEAVKSLPQSSEIKSMLLDVLEKTKALTFDEADLRQENTNNLTDEIAITKEQLDSILRRPGRFSTDEESKALQQYYTAISSPNEKPEQIAAALRIIEALPQSSEIKPLLTSILENTRQQVLNNVKKEYDRIIKEEQATRNYSELKQAESRQELESVNKEIERIQQEIEKGNTVNNQQSTVASNANNNNLPGSSSPTAMLPKNPLEDDYYQRLENAAKEGPIFHDAEEDLDLTPKENKPSIIKSIKPATQELKKKIRDSAFGKKVREALDFFAKHRLASLIVTGVVSAALGAATAMVFNAGTPESNVVDTVDKVIVDEQVTNKHQFVNNEINNGNASADSSINETEKTEDEQFEESLQETLNQILNGEAKVYTSPDRAANNIEARDPQWLSSWENATPGSYFIMVNGTPQNITEKEAKERWGNGEQVIVEMHNEGIKIGNFSMEHQESNTGKSR